MSDLSCQYDTVLRGILDNHAEQNTKSILLRQPPKWLSEDIKHEKRIRRKLERKMRRTKTECDSLAFAAQRDLVNYKIESSKRTYLQSLIEEAAGDQKKLFDIVKSLTRQNKESPLPEHTSTKTLANDFVKYFEDKIARINVGLSQRDPEQLSVELRDRECPVKFDSFKEVNTEDVRKLIQKSKSKSCSLDPLPTWLLKECMDELVQVITRIINMSFSEGNFPEHFKEALIIPLIKKIILERIFPSYRPVSNLLYLSKLTEKAAADQLLEHCNDQDLLEWLQSAYKCGHSIETALLRVQNDIFLAMDQQKCVLLVLLDLSAAFDTVDHTMLLSRLEKRCGITGTALKWFHSYLTNRSQAVIIGSETSEHCKLSCGVPQGSVLGPLLFTIYMSPLGDVMRAHDIDFHTYADDTSLYLVFTPTQLQALAAREQMENCISDIHIWMHANRLKLNDGKTEFLVMGTKEQRAKIDLPFISVGDDQVYVSSSAKLLGVTQEPDMKLKGQVNQTVKSVSYHLHNLAKIRKYLSRSACESLTHAIISSRLDFCNSLLYGLPKYEIKRLQKLQNTAARIVVGLGPRDHITPTLMELHWLKVEERIEFKVILLIHKALFHSGPAYIKDLLTVYQQGRVLRSQNNIGIRLILPKGKVTTGDRAFAYQAPLLWNTLPDELRRDCETDTFKTLLKTYLFRKCYDDYL